MSKSVCIVGSADSLSGKKLGEIIDSHDIVVRINDPQIEGYEEDVGSKTNNLVLPPFRLAGRYHNTWPLNMPPARFKSHPINKGLMYSLNTTKGEKAIVLNANLNFDFEFFFAEIKHRLHHEVVFKFADWQNVTGLEENRFQGTNQAFWDYWKERKFRSHRVPTNGVLTTEFYRSKYGKISVCGFGSRDSTKTEGKYHYWDTEKKNNLEEHSAKIHTINEDIHYMHMLHDTGSIVNLEF